MSNYAHGTSQVGLASQVPGLSGQVRPVASGHHLAQAARPSPPATHGRHVPGFRPATSGPLPAPSALLPPPPPLTRRPAPPSPREPSPRGLEHLRGPRTRFCADGRRRPRGVPEPGPRAWGQDPPRGQGFRGHPFSRSGLGMCSLALYLPFMDASGTFSRVTTG